MSCNGDSGTAVFDTVHTAALSMNRKSFEVIILRWKKARHCCFDLVAAGSVRFRLCDPAHQSSDLQ